RARLLEAPEGLGVIARRGGGLEVVDAVEEATEGGGAARGRDAAIHAAEGHEPHGVAAARGGVGHHEERLDRALEVAPLAVLRAHPVAAVEQEDHALVLLLAVLAADEAAVTRDGAPVDLPHRVALAEVAELVEFEAVAAHPLEVHAAARDASARRRDGRRDDAEVGVDARRRALADLLAELEEAEREPADHVRRLEDAFA